MVGCVNVVARGGKHSLSWVIDVAQFVAEDVVDPSVREIASSPMEAAFAIQARIDPDVSVAVVTRAATVGKGISPQH